MVQYEVIPVTRHEVVRKEASETNASILKYGEYESEGMAHLIAKALAKQETDEGGRA